MRYKKILLALLVLALFCIGIAACSKPDDPPQIEVGGGEVERPIYDDYEFSGLRDFHLRADVTSYDFLEGVTVDDDGRAVAPTCDTSSVVFGTPGAYPLKYSYRDVVKEQTVYVYGQPQIDVGEAAILNYAEAYDELFSDTSAKDSFDRPLDVFLVEDDGLYAADGSLQYGDFQLTYGAVDASGQLVTGARQVTVMRDESKEPSFGAVSAYDVVDAEFSLPVQLNGGIFAGVSLDGVLIPSENCNIRDGILCLDGDFLAANIGVGEKTMRLTTNFGYAETETVITDDAEPQIRAQGSNYIYPVETVVSLPDAERLNNRQNFTLTKTLLDESGEPVSAADGKFTANEPGIYRYLLNAVKPDGRSYQTEVKVRIVAADEYVSLIDPALSDQFTDRWKTPGNNDVGFKFGYDSDIRLAGVNGCLYMTTGTTGAWYNRIELAEHNNLGFISSVDISAYTKITAKMYFTGVTDLFVWLNNSDVRYSTGAIKIYDEDMQPVAYSAMESILNTWVTVEVPIGTYDSGAANTRLAVGAGQNAQGNFSTTFYLSDVRFVA